NGRVIENLPAIDVVKLDGVEGAFGLKLDNAGTIHQLSKADLDKVKSKASGTAKVTAGHLIIVADEKGKQVPLGAERGKIVAGQKLGAKGSVEVKITKDSKGNVTKKYVVDGKEVDKLPAHLQSRVTTISDKGLADRVRINTGEAIFVEGKKIEIGKEKIDVKGGQVTIGDKARGTQAVVGMTTKDDKITTFVSGHTSADYLVKILQDGEKWTISRGVTYNGQNFDKFVLKGGFSPIELYVDPATSLPKILRFTPPMADGVTIEDVYEYNIQP
ncbi:MAG TPA: hypothetical protein VK171_10135, partial [Fimbriimonas sp.]|nr:hypothetical protein [Fimbriimonas sp.]